jgi:jacalin-like lectin domain-containing protein
MQTMTMPRFRGPPNSGNGGYLCGMRAHHVPGVAGVTLRGASMVREADGAVKSTGCWNAVIAISGAVFVLLLAGLMSAWAQCARPEYLTDWDEKKGDFTPCHPPGGAGSLPSDHSLPGMDPVFASKEDHQEFCRGAYAGLLRACPPEKAGQNCRNVAENRLKLCLGQETKSTADDPMGRGQGSATGCKVLTAGQGGSRFDDTTSEIKGLSVRSGKYIDAIGVLGGPMHGGQGGSLQNIVFAPGEKVTEISGRSGIYVDSLVVITSAGHTYSFGGAGGGPTFHYAVPPNRSITGFCGRSGIYVDAIGVVIR